jgi:hypothetical protein
MEEERVCGGDPFMYLLDYLAVRQCVQITPCEHQACYHGESHVFIVLHAGLIICKIFRSRLI